MLPAAKPQNGMAHQVVLKNVKILFGNKLDLYSICKTFIQKKVIQLIEIFFSFRNQFTLRTKARTDPIVNKIITRKT